MYELTTTRHNALIDPYLHIWSWQIPVYLFIGGLVAGTMIITGYFILNGKTKDTNCTCYYLPTLSIILLSLGMLSLFLDLEDKLHVWRLYVAFEITSPMSWGSWILILVYPALISALLLRLPKPIKSIFPKLSGISENIKKHPYVLKNIGIVNMVLGALLGVYTGILLSTMTGRPLWNSSVMGILFLFSGLSSAAAFVHMIAKDRYERELLAKADNSFLTLEIIIIGMLLIGLVTSSEAQKAAANLLLSGPFAAVFWVFVIGIGMVIPLFLQTLAVNHKIKHTPVPPIMVILGGIILRFVFVYAGQASHWVSHTGLIK